MLKNLWVRNRRYHFSTTSAKKTAVVPSQAITDINKHNALDIVIALFSFKILYHPFILKTKNLLIRHNPNGSSCLPDVALMWHKHAAPTGDFFHDDDVTWLSREVTEKESHPNPWRISYGILRPVSPLFWELWDGQIGIQQQMDRRLAQMQTLEEPLPT